ncbi:hypothetical protein [Clostridium beijerinckii]|nr:hypothetical protein [Clostridium beijerinckii]
MAENLYGITLQYGIKCKRRQLNIYSKELNNMLYLYTISIKLSCLSLILLLFRLVLNKNNINIFGNKEKRGLLITILVISIVPIINIFFAASSIYASIFMKKEKFIKFINE